MEAELQQLDGLEQWELDEVDAERQRHEQMWRTQVTRLEKKLQQRGLEVAALSTSPQGGRSEREEKRRVHDLEEQLGEATRQWQTAARVLKAGSWSQLSQLFRHQQLLLLA